LLRSWIANLANRQAFPATTASGPPPRAGEEIEVISSPNCGDDDTLNYLIVEKDAAGTEQIVRATSERVERATVVALDPIVLLMAPN
jgi:hypothetical protein